MRAKIVNPIVQAAFGVLEEVLGTDISRRRLSKHDKTLALHRISALAGISGAVAGYVLFSMPLDVVLSIVELPKTVVKASTLSSGDFNAKNIAWASSVPVSISNITLLLILIN